MKRVLFYMIFAAFSFLTVQATKLEDFAKGANLPGCLEDCERYYRATNAIPARSAQKACWDICLDEYIKLGLD